MNKIIPALQSRCTRFRFAPLQEAQILGRMQYIVEKEEVRMSSDGKGMHAIIKLSGGDMRKCLNVLQACHASNEEVTEDAVYRCTGNPLPSDILTIIDVLLNQPFAAAYERILAIIAEKGMSLTDIVAHIHGVITRISFDPQTLCFVLDKLAEMEYRLAYDTSDKIQLGT